MSKERKCKICGKILSEYNKSPDKCYVHQMTEKEKKNARSNDTAYRMSGGTKRKGVPRDDFGDYGGRYDKEADA